MTRPLTPDEILSMVRTARQAAETAYEEALTTRLAKDVEIAFECGRQEGADARTLLKEVAQHITEHGRLENHGHRREGSACVECDLLNRIEREAFR